MAAVSEAFASVVASRAGPCRSACSRDFPGGRPVVATPNPWVEVPIRTHLPLSGAQGTDARSRNHINVLTADVVVGSRGATERAARWSWPSATEGR